MDGEWCARATKGSRGITVAVCADAVRRAGRASGGVHVGEITPRTTVTQSVGVRALAMRHSQTVVPAYTSEHHEKSILGNDDLSKRARARGTNVRAWSWGQHRRPRRPVNHHT